MNSPLLDTMEACNADADGFFSTARTIQYYRAGIMIGFHSGERRIGKTLYWTHVACRLYQDYGRTTLWLRNKLIEVQDANFTSSFLNDAKRLGWAPEEWEGRPDGIYTGPGKDGRKIIEFRSLSTYSNARGGAHPDCELIVLDEYQDETGRFPRQACTGLLSLTKTYLNGRETARVVCLSNTISAINPYFAHFRIYPDKAVSVWPDKGVLIERCSGQYRKTIGKRNAWQVVYRAGAGYGEYADERSDPRMQLIQRTPKGAALADFGIISNGNRYRIAEKSGRWYFRLWKGSPNGVSWMTADRDDVTPDAVLMDPSMRRNLKRIIDSGMARFDDPNVMFDILSAIFVD